MSGPIIPGAIPQPAMPEVRGGFGIAQENPEIGKLVIATTGAQFEVVMATDAAEKFLRQIADQIKAQREAAPRLARPIPGLFLPNGAAPR
jgi:hypothetical protein